MFLHGGPSIQECLLHMLNDVLRTGVIPTNWYETHFSLLHKGGCTEDANNWRPIAILSITYKIMARLIFGRLELGLELHQSEDQYGFRKHRSCMQALLAFELVLSKGIEYNIPIWIVSIDLKKAFDRIEHAALFHALSEQHCDPELIALLQMLYKNQKGFVGDIEFFINRGVRQGDILSPI